MREPFLFTSVPFRGRSISLYLKGPSYILPHQIHWSVFPPSSVYLGGSDDGPELLSSGIVSVSLKTKFSKLSFQMREKKEKIEDIIGERSKLILKKIKNEDDQEDKNKARHQKLHKNGEMSTMQIWDISFGEEENESKNESLFDVNSTHMHSPLFESGLPSQGMDPPGAWGETATEFAG